MIIHNSVVAYYSGPSSISAVKRFVKIWCRRFDYSYRLPSVWVD